MSRRRIGGVIPAAGMPGAAGSAPGEVSDPCPGQASTQSEGEFGVRDLCPSSYAWGVMLKFGFPLPAGREFRGMPIPIPGNCRDADAERGHRSLLLAFPGLGGGREQQYRYREIIERAE